MCQTKPSDAESENQAGRVSMGTGTPVEPVRLAYARRVARRRVPFGRIALWSAVCVVALVVLILPLLPRRPGSRGLGPRARCGANLRGLGQGLWIYQHDCGEFPPNLLTLVQVGHSTSSELHCPVRGGVWTGPYDYHYVTGVVVDDPLNWILAYDDPANHGDKGGNILYLDTHVEFLAGQAFANELKRFRDEYKHDRGEAPTILGREQPFQ